MKAENMKSEEAENMSWALTESQSKEVATRQLAKALAKFAEENGGGPGGPLLKFKKDEHFILGADKVPEGTEFVAYVQEVRKGWSKFEGKKLVEEKTGKPVLGFVLPEREELGDLDQTKWPKNDAGQPTDPWVKQAFLPLENTATGQLVIFVSSSHGGMSAIATLCGSAARNIHRGNPRIRLRVGSYKHPKFGRVQVPEFTVIGWDDPAIPAASFGDPDQLSF
jgi:hypothetical protein